ncbi:branched-chain amino acid ABC transporter permease [Pseudomonas typographi]|uniref:Branched-chain amino acid ABC transporter permease n=1 Tax=Pseudomonas typographi TaxID=2715964 RepID=A0ABR7Z418_9PSED|nr:branched-chain amino acid ABC transporter permease [Pseudomonas typographi]
MFDFCLHVLTLACLYGLMALALNLQAGYAGLLNFGHIAFVGVGAYAVGIGRLAGWPLPLSMLAGVACAMLLGVAVARLGRNLASDYWGIATLAVAEIVRIVVLNQSGMAGGAQGISALPGPLDALPETAQPLAFAVLGLFAVALAAWLSARLAASRFGRALRLLREQPALASCLGYDLGRLKRSATLASAAVAALAGSLLAGYTHFVSPDYLLAAQTFLVWSMLMIGGAGRVAGVLLGTVLVQGVYSFVPLARDLLGLGSETVGALRLGLIGAILLLCLLWRSAGLLPERLRTLP